MSHPLAWAADAVVPAVLAAGLGGAAVVDVARRRVPNAVSLGLAGAGLALAFGGATGVSPLSSAAGFALGLALMLPGHVFGATGAGDVKLFAAAGAVMGAGQVLEAFLFVAVAGGVLALAVAWHRGRVGRTFALVARMLGRSGQARQAIEAAAEHNRFPYAPAIAAGSLLAVLR